MRFDYKKIKPIRKAKGLTQGDIVDYLSDRFNKSYNRSTISSKECGRNPFSLVEIEALAELLEVDVSDFFEGEPVRAALNNHNNQGGSSEVVTLEIQSYLLQRIRELEAENKRLRQQIDPRDGAATPSLPRKKYSK